MRKIHNRHQILVNNYGKFEILSLDACVFEEGCKEGVRKINCFF